MTLSSFRPSGMLCYAVLCYAMVCVCPCSAACVCSQALTLSLHGRFAVGYLPLLLPGLSRVLYLQTDVVIRADVGDLFRAFELDGAPAGAVEDCSQPLASVVNVSHVAAAAVADPAVTGAGGRCTFLVWSIRRSTFLI